MWDLSCTLNKTLKPYKKSIVDIDRNEKDTIRTFFVAKNVLKKKATYTTNIAGILEMKVLLKEAFCGVFKTNVTRYMVQLIKKNSYEKLLESLPLLY